jgi:Predicted membrane protein (DUF2238)
MEGGAMALGSSVALVAATHLTGVGGIADPRGWPPGVDLTLICGLLILRLVIPRPRSRIARFFEGVSLVLPAGLFYFWFDGLVWIASLAVPVVILAGMSIYARLGVARTALQRWARSATRRSASKSAAGSVVGLGLLLTYLVARQLVDPGFTHYWGYSVLQVTSTMAVLLVVDVAFRAQGGLSWYTHASVVADIWTDTLGTAGHLYDRYAVYDKITHFAGGVALTAAAADILTALSRRGTVRWSLGVRLAAAVATTMVLNVGWETYEYLGDVVLHTVRHRGALDTTYDFVSDLVGGLVVVLSLWRAERARKTTQPAPRGFDGRSPRPQVRSSGRFPATS